MESVYDLYQRGCDLLDHGDYQAAISGRLALLGNRVGASFEQEVRQRLADLHTWQEGSVRATAARFPRIQSSRKFR